MFCVLYQNCQHLFEKKKKRTYSRLSKKFRISIGHMIFKLWIKTVKIMFWSIAQKPIESICYLWERDRTIRWDVITCLSLPASSIDWNVVGALYIWPQIIKSSINKVELLHDFCKITIKLSFTPKILRISRHIWCHIKGNFSFCLISKD